MILWAFLKALAMMLVLGSPLDYRLAHLMAALSRLAPEMLKVRLRAGVSSWVNHPNWLGFPKVELKVLPKAGASSWVHYPSWLGFPKVELKVLPKAGVKPKENLTVELMLKAPLKAEARLRVLQYRQKPMVDLTVAPTASSKALEKW